jgi:hypothetical protein
VCVFNGETVCKHVYKIALEKYKEYRFYKTKQIPVMRHYRLKATVSSPSYENYN